MKFVDVVKFLVTCAMEVEGFSRMQKKDFIRNKVKDSCIMKLNGKNFRYEWVVGRIPGTVVKDVCKICFLRCYNIGHTLLDELCHDIKVGVIVSIPELGDLVTSCHIVDPGLIRKLINNSEINGRPLTHENLAALQIPNGEKSLLCYGWMFWYFDTIGDKCPNNGEEKHLEPCNKYEIWDEYKIVMSQSKDEYISRKEFLSMWQCCFGHVKVRTFKAVQGKFKYFMM